MTTDTKNDSLPTRSVRLGLGAKPMLGNAVLQRRLCLCVCDILRVCALTLVSFFAMGR
jgi:hypothetical protein